jgi:hypothetical protein
MRIIRLVTGFIGPILVTTNALAVESKLRELPSVSINTFRAEDLPSLPYECECEFFRGPIHGATTVFATRNKREIAFAMIAGRLVTLRRNGKTAELSCVKNGHFYERWTGDIASVSLSYHVTGSGDEACWFKGTMRVIVGSLARVTSISGGCGC